MECPRYARLASLILALMLSGLARADDHLQSLLDKVFVAYGGTEVIAKTTVIQQSGVTYSSLRGAEGRFKRLLHNPDQLTIDIAYPSGTENRVLAGEQAWKQGRKTNAAMRMAMRLQAGRIWLPRTLWDYRDSAVYVGKTSSEDGSTREHIDIPLGEGMTLSAEIDPASGRILRSRGTLQMGGMAMVFGTAYADFRMHKGRLFAFKETHYAMGRQTGYSRIEELEFPFLIKKGQILL